MFKSGSITDSILLSSRSSLMRLSNSLTLSWIDEFMLEFTPFYIVK